MNKQDIKKISIVIPVRDEEDNVKILHEKIVQTMRSLNYDFEIIFVDDGSQDKTFKQFQQIHLTEP